MIKVNEKGKMVGTTYLESGTYIRFGGAVANVTGGEVTGLCHYGVAYNTYREVMGKVIVTDGAFKLARVAERVTVTPVKL